MIPDTQQRLADALKELQALVVRWRARASCPEPAMAKALNGF